MAGPSVLKCSGARARKLRSSASVRLIPRDGMIPSLAINRTDGTDAVSLPTFPPRWRLRRFGGPRATLLRRFALGYLLASLRDFAAIGRSSQRRQLSAYFREMV